MSNLRIKVCGITQLEQAISLNKLGIDFIGFIFYDKSKRLVADTSFFDKLKAIKKVGVFVNETENKILSIAQKLGLEYLQLHGNESPQFCLELKNKNYKIIKAIAVNEHTNLQEEINPYNGYIDYYLLDTKTENYGGSGKKFAWDILTHVNFKHPFFLSGGIGLEDVEAIKSFKNKHSYLPFFALDINSKFEISPGIKDLSLIEKFSKSIKS